MTKQDKYAHQSMVADTATVFHRMERRYACKKVQKTRGIWYALKDEDNSKSFWTWE